MLNCKALSIDWILCEIDLQQEEGNKKVADRGGGTGICWDV